MTSGPPRQAEPEHRVRDTGRLARRALRGPDGDPVWARPALLALLTATAVLYVWGLGASGWANSFYSAAVQAGTRSWAAFFFGSSDASNFITVDKTPMALWPMELTARVFGVNAWSILVPQALMGVATVGVVYAAVRRSLGPRADRTAIGGALLAGAVLATTPVAALMFRFNNPDALLVLLLTLGAYGVVRAVEGASTRWLVFAAACVGLGFLAKMLQAFLVVPAFALVYLLLAPAPVRRRIGQLLLAGVALVVAAGWWVAIVALVPSGSRPYIGGSQHDSVLELALGYNGLGRLNGDETGGLGNLNQDAGPMRMFGSELGGQVAWLLPAALVLLAAGLWLTRGRERRRELAGFALWGGWLLVTGLVFSLMQGIFHGYYTVALAPAVAALTGMGAAVLWRERRRPVASFTLAGTVALTAWWSYVLLGRTPDFVPWLRFVVLVGGLLAAALLASAGRAPRRLLGAALIVAALTSIAGPAAYAVETAGTPHTGAIPTAGPSSGRGGMPGFGGRAGGMGRGFRPQGGGRGGFPGGGLPGGGFPGGPRAGGGGSAQPPGGGMRGPGGGGPGGLLNATTPSAALTAALEKNARSYTWVAATVGSNNAAGYQLATGEPVMAIGGFNGTDPAPGLRRFQEYVRAGRIHYFIGGSTTGMVRGTSSGGSDVAQRIAAWVQRNFTAETVGGTTVYDLSSQVEGTA
ncbi:glycosyltransferase family 39 protein [Actinoallomurus spadix]|uniref:Glycosyl transferase n=1 Tax=Actinoallomurus spadix TaxID=79912 RepID=A0ABN0XTX3_9ACTN|nr:glycosyltransferase family 39 protein [Actinoallomurus spadix]MCO5990512.1 glycosyltransferase family 39 protein [Actinoallomurus spadix]